MKKYIKYIFVSILFFLIADIIIGFVSYSKLKSPDIYFFGEINKAIADTSQIFILGSSRAECHYNSKELQLLSGKSVFNAGAGGYGVFYSYAILKERLKLNLPQIVVLDVEPTIMFDIKQFGILTRLQPMADIYPSFNEIVKLNPDYHPFLMFFNTYKYNSTAYNIVTKVNKYDSFNSLNGTISKDQKIGYYDPYEFSSNDLKTIDNGYTKQLLYIDKIYALCQDNGIKLYFVTSPAYVDYDKDNIIKMPLRRHFKNKGYQLIDFVEDKRFDHQNLLFKDQMHLNGNGAKLFTKAFADSLVTIDEK